LERGASLNSQVLATLATCRATALCDETFALRPLASQLARTANGFSLLASPLLRRLFVMIPTLHFTESTFPLHLLFQRAERLLHIIVAHYDLYDGSLSIKLDKRSIPLIAGSPEARAIAELRRRVHTAKAEDVVTEQLGWTKK
jgi:hypothetical protein